MSCQTIAAKLAPAAGLAILLATAPLAHAQDKTFELKLVALGAAVASAAEGASRNGRQSVEKASGGTIKYKIYPSRAARQGVRPLRHGARRHRRLDLHQSGLSAGPLPDHRRRRAAVPDGQRQGRLVGARRLVPQIRRDRDEGREVLPRLRARSGLVPFAHQEDRGARRHQGHEDQAGARHHGGLDDAARRAPTCRRAAPQVRDVHREGRRRRGDLPVGLGRAVRRRQGHQVSHGRAALRHHVRLHDEQGHLRAHVGVAEEGDRRSLHQRMGRQVRRAVGRLRARRHRQDQGRARPRGLYDHRRAARRVEEVGRAAGQRTGPTT